MTNAFFPIVSLIIAGAGLFAYWQSWRLKVASEKREANINRRMYELAILKELGDRIGYSLNVHEIIDIITGSLHQFIDYCAVSYMLLEPEKVIFKVHLEKSVHREFINDIRDRMLNSLAALLNRSAIDRKTVDEVLTGAILIEDIAEPVRSFFNIPLVIGDKVVGILTIADIKAGLYKEEEMTILYKITRQASNAVTKLQEVVQTEQYKLNSMVESMTEGVVMTDKDYRVAVANPAVKRILGLEGKKEVTIFDFIDHLESKFDIRGKLEESVKLDKVLEAQEVLINERFFQIFVSPVKSAFGVTEGEILGGVVIFRDITEAKAVEQLRKDFTSMMVHELRSPLEGIRNMAELVVRRKTAFKPEKFIKEYAPLIYHSSSEMLRLINDLLDAAKVEAGKFEVIKEPADIKKIVSESVEFYRPSAEEAGIELTSVFGPYVPEKVSLDSGEISRVINNLISNALKFTPPQGRIVVQALFHKEGSPIAAEAEAARITWFIRKGEQDFTSLSDSLVVAVTDTGSGISSEGLPLLFNKFKQFRSAAVRADKKGTGLGLAIAKGIVEAHDGTIGAASDKGAGSTFYFTVPLQ